MSYEEILENYQLEEDQASAIIENLHLNKQKISDKTEIPYHKVDRISKAFEKMSDKERNAVFAHLSINNLQEKIEGGE